jgi:hypothetical protein
LWNPCGTLPLIRSEATIAINNLLLVADKTVFTDVDLSLARSGTLAASAAALLLGLVWETR